MNDRFIDPNFLPSKVICDFCDKEMDTEKEKVYEVGTFLVCEECYEHDVIEDE